MAHLGDVVLRRLDAGDVGAHGGVHLAGVAAGGHEGDVVLAEVLADQASGVAGGAIDDDGPGAHGCWSCLLEGPGHMPMPPSTERPAPVMKRAASEARNTTTSAM